MSPMRWEVRNVSACFMLSTMMMLMAGAATPPTPNAALPRLPAPINRSPQLRELAQDVQDAVIARYPELTSGPDRSDSAMVDLVMRADGSIESIEMVRSVPGVPNFTNPPRGQPTPGSVVQGLANMAAGSLARNGARLRSTVVVRYTALGRPIEGNDTARAPQRVHEAVRVAFPELLLPMNLPQSNRITVFMTEDGRISKHYVEQHTQERIRQYGDIDPQSFAALWEPMGLRADELGTMGITTVVVMPTSVPAVNDPRNEEAPKAAVVLYAWPRRPGEPIGGTPQSDASAELATRVTFTYTEVAQVLEQLLPGALNDRGIAPNGAPWLVMSRDGSVLRSGYIPPPTGNIIGVSLLQPLVPDLRLKEFMPLRVVKKIDGAFNKQVWLAWVAAEP
jgi:hypothetical protein